MTDLLLIHPNSAGAYADLDEGLVAVEPPLWCRLIAGYIRDRGFSVEIVDSEAHRLTPRNVAVIAATRKPKLICIVAYGHQPSSSTQQMVAAGAIATEIKRACSAPVIIVGGHVSALPERTMAEEDVDYACVGEGPLTILGLLKGDDLASIPGLVWHESYRKGSLRINKSAALIDIDHLHGNVWHILPMNKYRAHNWQGFGWPRAPYASIHTSLGCPYKCSFCCINSPFKSNQYRMRRPEDVVAEINVLYLHFGVRTFKITDEMFVLNENHYSAICHGLIEAGISHDINIWAYARIDTVKPETLTLLRMAGIRWLALGIESGSAHVRDGAKKTFKRGDIAQVVEAIRSHDINVIGNYIFGLPDDDLNTMQETLELAMTLNTEFANFYSAMAYPGSALYDHAKTRGMTLPDKWSGYSQHSTDCRPLDTNHVDGARVLQFRDDAFLNYFGGMHYQNMVMDKFGLPALYEVQRMNAHRLKRDLLDARVAAE